MHLTAITVLLALLLEVSKTALSCSLSSYLTLVQTQYTLDFSFSTQTIPSGTVPTLSLSSRYRIEPSSLSACSFKATSASVYSSCSCLPSSNSTATTVTFPDVYSSALSSQNSLSLKLTINNPWAATTESVTLALVSAGTNLASDFATIPFTASPLTNCSWTSSSPINGYNSSRTVSFLPSAPVISGSYLSISLPFWFGTLLNLATSSPSCSALTNVDGSPSCSNTTSGSEELYQISNLFASNKTVSGLVSLNLGTVSNPWSKAPFGPISFSLLYAQSSTAYLSQQCTGVYQSTSQLGTMSSFKINFFSKISFKSYFQTGWFKVANPLPASGGQLHISWSGGVSISVSTGSSPSLLSANSSYLSLGSFSSDYYPNSNISIFSRFTVVAPPSSRPFTISATTYYLQSGTLYGIDSISGSFSCPSGSLSPAAVSTNTTNIGVTAQLTLSFTLTNPVYQGSFISVAFPSELSTSGSCSTNVSGVVCLVSNSSYANLSVSGTVPSATVIQVTFSVRNPSQALTTSSFAVASYIDYLTDGLIDSVSAGLTLTYAASPLPSNSLHILPSNSTTHVLSNYTLSAQLDNAIPAQGYILIILPSQLTVTTPTLIDASFPTASCNLSVIGHNLTLNGCFPSGLATLSLYVVVGPIGNPPTLASSDSLQFYTFGPTGSIDYLLDGPKVTMTALAVSTAFSLVPSSNVVHASATYTFAVTFYSNRVAGDYLLLPVPTGMQVPAGVACSPISGVTALSCSAANSSTLKVTLNALPALAISFQVSPLQNYDVGSTLYFKVTTYSALGLSSEITYDAAVTYSPSAMTGSTVLNDQLVINMASNLTVMVSAPFALSSALAAANTQIIVTLPSDISSLANSSCAVQLKACTAVNATTFTINSVGLAVDNLTIVLFNVVLNYATTSQSLQIHYQYSGQPVASITDHLTAGIYCVWPCQQCTGCPSCCLSCLAGVAPIYFAPNYTCVSACPDPYFLSSGSCQPCLASCASCNSSTSCLTCATNYFMWNQSCTDTCPSGTYLTSLTCLSCDASCLTCNSTSTYCLSCSSPLLFYNQTCLGSCPPATYNSTNTCEPCSSNCLTCSAFATCTSCSPPLLHNIDHTCTPTCPAGTIPDANQTTCLSCTNNCTTCINSTSTCLSCPSSLLLYSSSCIATCPSNYFNQSGQCLTCSNCVRCLSVTTCGQCLSSYYLYASTCYSTCPSSAPVADTQNMLCTPCGTICSACSTPSYCTICKSPYLLFLGTCLQQCPSGYQINPTSRSCSAIKPVTYIYAPTSATTAALLLLALIAKATHPVTILSGNAAALLSLGAAASTIIFTLAVKDDTTIDAEVSRLLLERNLGEAVSQSIMLLLGIVAVGCSVVIGASYVCWLGCRFSHDPGLKLWKERSAINRYSLNVLVFVTIFRMPTLRLAYNRWFGRECFSCYLRDNRQFLKHTVLFTSMALLLSSGPAIAVAICILAYEQGQRQTQLYALDCLVLCTLEAILLLIEMCLKDKAHFSSILKELPYLRKFRKYQEMESSDGSLISMQEPEQTHPKTEANARLSPPPSDFPLFQRFPEEGRASIAKTLPEHNNLIGEVLFDPYEERRKNDELFFREQEYTHKFQELKDSYQREEHSEEPDEHTENELLPPKTVEDIIRELPEQQPKTVVELLNEKPREVDPADYLQHISPEDCKPIPKEDQLFLQSLSQKHQLDPPFVAETFGTKKNYNFSLLSKAIDHHEVPSSSVQALINPNNKQETLQTVLGRDSEVEPQRIRELLKDEQGQPLIKALFHKKEGWFDSQTASNILNQVPMDFLKALTGSEEIDREKLKKFIRGSGEGEEVQKVKMLSELAGSDFKVEGHEAKMGGSESKMEGPDCSLGGCEGNGAGGGVSSRKMEIIDNMLGWHSQLDPSVIPKVRAEMSERSKANIFGTRSKANSTVIKKVINNKSIALQPLNPIHEIPEIVEEFAELLNCGNERVERELIEVLERGTYDGELLKELVCQAGNSQEQMGKLLKYIDQHKHQQQLEKEERPLPRERDAHSHQLEEQKQIERLPSVARQSSPVDVWPDSTPDLFDDLEEEGADNYLDFDLVEKPVERKHSEAGQSPLFQHPSYPFEEEKSVRESKSKSRVVGYRKKELPHLHLPSEHIYLQRIQGAHEVQKKKAIRRKKRKTENQPHQFMDEDNEIYDLDF